MNKILRDLCNGCTYIGIQQILRSYPCMYVPWKREDATSVLNFELSSSLKIGSSCLPERKRVDYLLSFASIF